MPHRPDVAQADRPSRLHLVAPDDLNPGAQDFGDEAGMVKRQAENAAPEGGKNDAELRQTEIKEKQMDERRDVPKKLDIGAR